MYISITGMNGRRKPFLSQWLSVMNIGEIVAIGQEVKGFKIGDRVSGEGHIAATAETAVVAVLIFAAIRLGWGLTEGCFAEYLVIPALMLLKFPIISLMK